MAERLTLEEVIRRAAKYHGSCLSTKYINAHTPLKFKCKEGHIFSARPHNILRHWCPECNRSVKSRNAKKQWDNPNTRDTIQTGIRKAANEPSLRGKRRAGALTRWKDKDFRDKVIAAQSGPNNSNWIPDRSQVVHRGGLGFSKSQVNRLLENKCEWCGSIHKLQLDHIHPVCAGGDSMDSNAQTLCVGCNNVKRSTTDRELQIIFRKKGGRLRKPDISTSVKDSIKGIEERGKLILGVGTRLVRIQVKCSFCGATTQKQPCQVKRAKKNLYCSEICRLHALNGAHR